jgi:hypothetical protein
MRKRLGREVEMKRKRSRTGPDTSQQDPVVIEVDAEVVEPEVGALVGAEVGQDHGPAPRPSLALCSLCGGPALFCGGADLCHTTAAEEDQRWLTAIRSLYAGLLLSATEAASWGGALVRIARRTGAGIPPSRLFDVVSAATDPMCEVSPNDVTQMALSVLVERDLDVAFDLQCALGRARASWLGRIWHLADRAVRAIPMVDDRFPLVATACDACARKVPAMVAALVAVDTYDAAIRCPVCDMVPPHPFPWVKVGEPHPVGRCTRGPTKVCMVHGYELDVYGLCMGGREVVERAVMVERAPGPKDPVFLDAMARARRLWIEGEGMVRAVVMSDACGPTFAALAAANPETAKVLERMTGAPIDVTKADPAVLAQVTRHPSLSSLVAEGIAALKVALPLGELGEQPAPLQKRLPVARRRRRGER